MKKNFINAKKSAEITGKSEITIKRFIKNRFTKASSEGDQKVLEMITKKKAPKGYFWLVDENFLREEFGIESEKSKKDQTIDILTSQLLVKDEQIKSLLDGQRESNILMKGLQDKVLSLNSGKPDIEQEIDYPVDQKSEKIPEKKGFWARFWE